uniref:Transcription factor IIIA n=1 Tax=Oryzias sinensis TaxID=183150 RepID=A0A8C8E1M3_9TELE
MGEKLQSQKTYSCSFSDCKSTFGESWKLEAHLCKHTGLKPFSCGNCEKRFCTQHQLTRHELSHSEEKPIMKNHVSNTQELQKKHFNCDHKGCGKEFHKRNQLKTHMCEHQPLLPFHCRFPGCAKEFLSNGKRRHHEKVHQGYSCNNEVCPYQAKTWTELQKHKKEHEVKVQCGACQKLFSNKWFLHLHELRVHSGEKRLLSCPREGCDRKFMRRFNLESHVLGEHEGKKPFICAHAGCGKSFAMKESLRRHGAVHDPEKKKLKRPDSTNSPKQMKQQISPEAAASQEETNKLAESLHTATLEDVS